MKAPAGVMAIAAALLAAAAIASEEIAWESKPAAAMARAVRSGDPLLVDLWAVWCAPCKVMEETTYRDAGVVSAAARFVPLKVDADVNELFVERYRVEAFPTVLFLDHDGAEIARREGLVAASDLLAAMETVRDGYDAYVAAKRRSDDVAAQVSLAAYLADVGNHEAVVDACRRGLKLLERAADTATREAIELRLASALGALGRHKPAVRMLETLGAEATLPATRGGALALLVRLHRERGDAAAAERALATLRGQFPGLAAELAGDPATVRH